MPKKSSLATKRKNTNRIQVSACLNSTKTFRECKDTDEFIYKQVCNPSLLSMKKNCLLISNFALLQLIQPVAVDFGIALFSLLFCIHTHVVKPPQTTRFNFPIELNIRGLTFHQSRKGKAPTQDTASESIPFC